MHSRPKNSWLHAVPEGPSLYYYERALADLHTPRAAITSWSKANEMLCLPGLCRARRSR